MADDAGDGDRRTDRLGQVVDGAEGPAKAEIHRVMDKAAADSTAIVLCSSDHDEVARLCDRTLVLRKGVVVRELSRSEVDADILGDLVS